MTFFMLLSAALSALLLGAHFFRDGNTFFTLVYVAMFFLLFWRHPWSARIVQAALIVGVVEWVKSAMALMHERQAAGEPYTRMLIILGAVAAFTLVSAILFETGRLQRHFGLVEDNAAAEGEADTPSATEEG
ncbi:MAG: hypothetical protein ACYC7E_19935 [Armatimonadota bacterium]